MSFALVVDALDAYGDILPLGTPPLTHAVESMKIRLALPNGRISTDSLHALVDATSLAALDVRHLMSSPSCIMSTFASARLGGLTLLSNNATLEIQCKTGGSVSSFNSDMQYAQKVLQSCLFLAMSSRHNWSA